MNKKKFTKNDVLQAIQNLAKLKGRNWLGRKEFVRETGISEYYVYKYFDNWNDAVKEAGLKPMDKNFRPFARSYSKEDILKKMRELAKKLERNTLQIGITVYQKFFKTILFAPLSLHIYGLICRERW